jgi:peptide subunit release factor 1 (eRF1)
MRVEPPDREQLRRLAELRLERPVVLSLYLDLDPTEFATPPARATAVRSLVDEAERKLRERDSLTHEDRVALEASLARARTYMERQLATDGTGAVALFASEPANLFEVLRLPRSVRNRVAIDRSPLVGPLAALERRDRWCVALVNRRDARFLRGSPEGLRELTQVHDDVHGQHDQGGWSQARYQRSVDKEAADHLKHAAEVLFRNYRRRPFEHLLVGGPEETAPEFKSKLHPYLQERLAGRVEVDVENSTPEQVLDAARSRFEAAEEQREREAIDRLNEGVRAVSGLEQVLPMLNERRVEALLLDDDFSAEGSVCPACGWVGPGSAESCPADGATLEARPDVAEEALELAIRQSAEVIPMRRHFEELRSHGGIGALLRF